MTLIFWLSALFLVYPLVIYPFCLILFQKFFPYTIIKASNRQNTATDDFLPHVSIILSAFNEEKIIKEKLENYLALDYPKNKLEFLILSDESTDKTDKIIQEFIDFEQAKPASEKAHIRLLRQEPRQGKTMALNRGAKEAFGEILFFTDADSMLKKDAMREIVAPFSDKTVGLVSGRSVYLDEAGNETTGSIYRRYEEWIKEYEGMLWGIVGADGGIYALRKEEYKELPTKIINDLAHPIQVILNKKRAVAVSQALIYEAPEDDANAFARQSRIMSQSWHVFFQYFTPLCKEKSFGFLWQFFSHKVLRWLTVVWLFAFILSSFYLQGIIPLLGLVASLALIVCALLGEKAYIFGRISRLFLVQGVAALYGLFKLWQGEVFITWNPKGK